MKTWIRIAFVFLLAAMLVSNGAFAAAALPQVIPPQPEDEAGNWAGDGQKLFTSDDFPAQASPQMLLSTGGPDEYGYTWTDAEPYAWKSAAGGTNVVLDSSIDIGFAFKYYENSYTRLYVSKYGYVSFNNTNLNKSQSRIPDVSTPNDVIAPHWVPVDNFTYIRYLKEGVTPNQTFTVEWNRLVSTLDGDDFYTFEVILHENGNIVFQYETITLTLGRWCESSGIENSTGLDGLSITPLCFPIASNHAVRITRPAPAARVSIPILFQGKLSSPGASVAFPITIRNTGELGADTYDLTVSSAWTLALLAGDGITPLTDTDGDTKIDTGSVPQGGSVTIAAVVQVSGGAGVGDAWLGTVSATSSLDPAKQKTATLQSAIPAPFAQSFMDTTNAAESLYLAKAGAQQVKKVTPNSYYGNEPSVVELPNGNLLTAWYKGRYVNNARTVYASEIEFTILNKYGETVRPVSKLTDHYNAVYSTYDYSPVAAVTPDGKIGVTWYRSVYNNGQYNYNIYLAILDSTGNVVLPPTNLTNNTLWSSSSSTPDVPRFYNPRIAGTTDNKFAVSWNREQYISGCTVSDCSFYDIYYTVRSSAGAALVGPAKFTSDTTGSMRDGYVNSSMTALAGSKVLLTWYRQYDGDVYYAVLDSAGGMVKDQTSLSYDLPAYDNYGPDAAQLSDGKIVVSWYAYMESGNKYQVACAVLENTAYTRTVAPAVLNNPAAATLSEYYISIAPDGAGHAVITWTDQNQKNLYYSLVNGSGSVLTPPMIMVAGVNQVVTSRTGYGNTTYSSTIASAADGAFLMSRNKFFTPVGQDFWVDVRLTNHGLATASGVTLSMVLPTGLTYVGDTSGVAPVVTDQTYTWTLPDINLTFLSERVIGLYLHMPDTAALGTAYPLNLTLTVAGDSVLADNTFAGTIYPAVRTYQPAVIR